MLRVNIQLLQLLKNLMTALRLYAYHTYTYSPFEIDLMIC